MADETLAGKRVHYANYGWLYEEKDVKEFIKKRTEKLKIIEKLLKSNSQEDWDVALMRIRALIEDKDKLAGEELTNE